MHIVGVPIKEGNKNGMSKLVGKTAIFTKDSLKLIQDKMRELCIESFNNEYGLDDVLKEKLFGWGKKELMYKKVVDDLYNKGILDDDDIKCIEKKDYEL
jgi:hypothetical protein